MKRGSAVVLMFLMYSALLVSHGLARETLVAQQPDEPSQRCWQPPYMEISDPKMKKCWSTFDAVEYCVQEIYRSFWHKRFSIGKACCKAIKEVNKDCFATMFEHFNNPLYGHFVREHCTFVLL